MDFTKYIDAIREMLKRDIDFDKPIGIVQAVQINKILDEVESYVEITRITNANQYQ